MTYKDKLLKILKEELDLDHQDCDDTCGGKALEDRQLNQIVNRISRLKRA